MTNRRFTPSPDGLPPRIAPSGAGAASDWCQVDDAPAVDPGDDSNADPAPIEDDPGDYPGELPPFEPLPPAPGGPAGPGS